MNESNFELQTNDGSMGCFAARPDTPGPFPAVILYMDAPGIREELRDFTRRIAAQGYYCLLPDMYYRLGEERFDLSKGDQEEFKKMFAAMSTLNIDLVMSDTGSMLKYFDNNENVAGSVGCIGYCMSGQYVVAAAGHYPDEFNAVASLYGVGIVTDKDNSPHLLADRIKAELYLGFAEQDEYVSDNVVPDLTQALEDRFPIGEVVGGMKRVVIVQQHDVEHLERRAVAEGHVDSVAQCRAGTGGEVGRPEDLANVHEKSPRCLLSDRR